MKIVCSKTKPKEKKIQNKNHKKERVNNVKTETVKLGKIKDKVTQR